MLEFKEIHVEVPAYLNQEDLKETRVLEELKKSDTMEDSTEEKPSTIGILEKEATEVILEEAPKREDTIQDGKKKEESTVEDSGMKDTEEMMIMDTVENIKKSLSLHPGGRKIPSRRSEEE